MSGHVVPVRTNIAIFVALLILLFATVGAAYLPLESLHLPLALTIAAAKAVLIGLFFMHLYYSHQLDLDRLSGVVALAGDSACAHTQRLSVPGLARHSGKVRGERARFSAVCALNRVSSPCSSTPVGRLPGMNPPMLAPRHPHLERSSAPTKVVRRRSLNDHVVVDRVRHPEEPRRHASRGRAHRRSTCCPVYCVLECP